MKMHNQRTQIIVFCCLIAVVLGLGVFKVIGGNKPNNPTSPDQAAAVEQSTQAKPDEPSDAERDAGPPKATQVSAVPAYKPRDPFIPQVIEESYSSRNALRNRPTPLVSRMPKLPLPLITPLHPQPIDFGPNSVSQAAPDPTSVLRLTGVIEGSCSVAIIRGEGGARYIVREGQSIDGKFLVQSISRTGVRLRYAGKTYILSLGAPPASKSS